MDTDRQYLKTQARGAGGKGFESTRLAFCGPLLVGSACYMMGHNGNGEARQLPHRSIAIYKNDL